MTPAVRVRADTVLTRLPAAGSLARFRRAVSASFVAPTFADSQTGTLIFGGIVAFEQVGATSIPVAHGRLLPLSRGVRDASAMRRYARAGSFTAPVFADSQTGSLIFGGSSTESKTGTDSSAGTLIFSGSRVESASFSQTATGTLIFTGTGVDGYSPPAQPFTWVQVGWFVKVS